MVDTLTELVGLTATPPVGGVGNNGAVSSIRRQPDRVSDRTTRITIRLTSLITANRLLAQKNATPRIIPDFKCRVISVGIWLNRYQTLSITDPPADQCVRVNPNSTLSTSAFHDDSMMFVPAPTVLHRSLPFCVSMSTRVYDAEPL